MQRRNFLKILGASSLTPSALDAATANAKNEFKESWDKYGDLWSPEKEDNRVMGTSVMWRSVKGKKA